MTRKFRYLTGKPKLKAVIKTEPVTRVNLHLHSHQPTKKEQLDHMSSEERVNNMRKQFGINDE